MTPEVTAADRAMAQACIRRDPTGIQGDEWSREVNVLKTVNAIATALATVRAEGADVVLERDELLAERYEAIEALTQHKALQARVTTLEADLEQERMLSRRAQVQRREA